MNLSEENTKELESYGVWVKNTSKENSNPSESADVKNENAETTPDFSSNTDELDLPDFDSTDFSDMFKDDSQFATTDSQNDDFTSGLDSTLSTDELSNITDFAGMPIENADYSSDSEIISEDTDTVSFDEISQNSDDFVSETTFDDYNSDEAINDTINIEENNDSTEDSEISFDAEEEISLDDFMDEGFSDESVAAGNNGYEPGKEKAPTPFTPNPGASETEELSLDDFMDGDFETVPEDVPAPKDEIIEDEPPLEMDLTFDDSVETVETEDNISVETYDDFDEDSVAIETEEISLDDFGTVFDTPDEPKEETKPQASVNMSDTEEIDLSDFGIDADAEETPINQDVEEAKKKDTIVDYDLFVGDESTTSAPVVNEIKSTEKNESTEQITHSAELKNDSENQNSAQTVSSVDTSILQQIMAELQNLKNDINTLKNNIEEIKAEEAEKSVQEQKDIEIPQEEKKDEGGFFSDLDDDDTIALSFDELDNIMNNADFSDAKNDTDEPVIEETAIEESPATEETFSEEEIVIEEPAEEDSPVIDETFVADEPVSEESVVEETPAPEETFDEEEIVIEEPAEEDSVIDETFVAEEPVIEETVVEETSAPEETFAEQEIVIEEPAEEESPVIDETFVAEEPVIEESVIEETSAPDETLENIISAEQSEDEINFDFEDESLEEPEIESFSEISIDENFEEDLPEEISIPKEDDIFVESNSEDFMETDSTEDEDNSKTVFDEPETSEEPFETVDSFDNDQIDDDIPTVEKLLENQDTDSILESDNAAFERDQQNQQSEISVEDIQAENQPEQENFEDDFIDLANSDILDQEPVIEETAVDIDIEEENIQENSETEPVFDTFENISNEPEQDSFNIDFDDSLSEQIIEEPAVTQQNEPEIQPEFFENEPSNDQIIEENSIETSSDSVLETAEIDSVSNENEIVENDNQIEEKPAESENVQTQKPLSQDLMQDVKSLLVYMDQLLEDLPEEKIEEFANSDKFVLFKNVFEKLGLN